MSRKNNEYAVTAEGNFHPVLVISLLNLHVINKKNMELKNSPFKVTVVCFNDKTALLMIFKTAE